MKVLPHLRNVPGWVASVQVLILALLIPQVVGFPIDFLLEALEDDYTEYNVSTTPVEHLFKRDSNYGGLIFQSGDLGCTATQKQYIKDELDEVKTMLSRAVSRLRALRGVLMDKTQPKDWGTRYAEYAVALYTWQAYFGRIQLGKRSQAGTGGALDPFVTATTKMQTVITKYTQIYRKISDSSWEAVFNCNDKFLEYTEEKTALVNGVTTTLLVYKDTRTEGASQGVSLRKNAGGLCFENANTNGWTFKNKITQKQEICLCPNALTRYGTSKLTDITNTAANLNGKTINDMKARAGATTILHELTHCETILEAARTKDLSWSGGGSSGLAYNAQGVRKLAYFNPGSPTSNADSYALFALAMYYGNCNWTEDKCGDVTGDLLRKRNADTGEFVYATFAY